MRRILLVEDDHEFRETLREYLISLGLEVEAFGTPAEALTCWSDGSAEFDLVLTDLELPGATGMDLLRTIRERGHQPPAILLTGHGGAGLSERVAELDAVTLLRKPVRLEELEEALRSATLLDRS